MVLGNLFRRKRKPVMGSPRANDAVRERLRAYGDDGERIRHILHYAYPDADRELHMRPAIIETLISRGFGVSDAAVASGIVLEHFETVAPDTFDVVTAELSAWFAERGWEYDGWECEVLKKDEKSGG